MHPHLKLSVVPCSNDDSSARIFILKDLGTIEVRLKLSLLSIVSDDDISVGFRRLRALLVGERIVQFEI